MKHTRGPKIGKKLLSAEQIQERSTVLGKQISRDYRGKTVLLVGVLKGSFVFLADLMRQIDLPIEIDFIAVSSYGGATKSSGSVRIVKDLEADIVGRDVIIVEDIVDSGLTLNKLKENLQSRQPKSLEVCSLLVREELKGTEHGIKYVGFYVPNHFVVGYGLDAAQQYRNLPDIHKFKD